MDITWTSSLTLSNGKILGLSNSTDIYHNFPANLKANLFVNSAAT